MLNRKTRTIVIALVSLMALLALAMQASAKDAQRQYQDRQQNRQQQQYQQGAPDTAANIDEATLDGVAQAYVEVAQIRHELQDALSEAGDAENARKLQGKEWSRQLRTMDWMSRPTTRLWASFTPMKNCAKSCKRKSKQ